LGNLGHGNQLNDAETESRLGVNLYKKKALYSVKGRGIGKKNRTRQGGQGQRTLTYWTKGENGEKQGKRKKWTTGNQEKGRGKTRLEDLQ